MHRFGALGAYTPKHLAERILTSKAALEGERKQITVLFADPKGSMEAVHRFEGTVNQVMGDGIMALFGAPLAHEDHAVRACYAALRMQESVTCDAEGVRRQQGIAIRIRVGMNSGEVVVRAIGSDLHRDYTAVGQTTHLAARRAWPCVLKRRDQRRDTAAAHFMKVPALEALDGSPGMD